MIQVYKVVSVRDTILRSAILPRENRFAVEYKPGKMVRPRFKDLPLLAFSSQDLAQWFVKENGGSAPHQIWLADAKPSNRTLKWVYIWGVRTFAEWLEIDPQRSDKDWPTGTVLCDWVRLKQRCY